MSRKGKNPITIPSGVEVKVENSTVKVKGPNGTLEQLIDHAIDVSIEGQVITVSNPGDNPEMKKFHGLYRALIDNMVIGVSKGFEKSLEMIGVGYRAAVKGQDLDLQLGFSHPTVLRIPEGLTVEVQKNTQLTVKGANKQSVGQFAANIRAIRPPEPYKGKGVRYKDEYVRRKAGKSAGKGK